jgi:hypothetical protein
VITGTTYYVSPDGSDANSGTSPEQAWKTIARANQAALKPGDGVLFEGGATFSDNTLMPNASGTAGAPIVFGSYGNGQATIATGVWFIGDDYLTFDDLALGPQSGLQGGRDADTPANHITVQRCTIDLGGAANPRVGIYSYGDDWTIEDNTIEDIGNSGMLLNGDSYTISGNTIDNTGLDAGISYGKHGIYLRVSNALVTGNTITHFSADGISPRFRSSTISGNYIAFGAIGIGFFQYDTVPGTSHWTGNTIVHTSDAGVYVNNDDGNLMESFVISGNTIQTAGTPLNLSHGSGTYTLAGNTVE